MINNNDIIEKEIKRIAVNMKPYKVEVIFISTNFFPGSGDYEDPPEVKNNRYGNFIKLIIRNMSYENPFENIRYYENMEEANKFLEKYIDDDKKEN